MIEIGNDRPQGAQADIAGTGAISDDVASSSDFRRAAIGCSAKAA
jgi:hypothetical protein